MKNLSIYNVVKTWKRLFPSTPGCALSVLLLISASWVAGAAETGKAFASPEEAVSALSAAASAEDTNALRVIFGPESGALVNPDRVQASNELREFVSLYNQSHRIIRQTEAKCLLEIGNGAWPFPVPLVKQDDRWIFDTAEGKEELLNRRIGRNERLTLESMRAYVEAQREYAGKDRDGDQVLEYAQKIMSTPGRKDGLYWPVELDGEASPLGPLAAQAQHFGYRSRKAGEAPEPFHGYFFKILTRQGKAAPLGKYNYIINGKMIAGFALVAWPAHYGESGIMSFIVNQQGRVYQKDLGPKTAAIAAGMTEYNPDNTWALSPD